MGQLEPVQQTTPQMPGPLRGAAHMLLPVQALPEPQRQTGVVPPVSHHSPEAQHPVPQHGPPEHVVHDASGPQTRPAPPAPPDPAPA
jgi:hypothetical protein